MVLKAEDDGVVFYEFASEADVDSCLHGHSSAGR